MEDIKDVKKRLANLKIQHRDLDDEINHLVENTPFDQLEVQRLKKRKLVLKDQIMKLKSNLLPDIIA